tara:strand:+ start:521 stop:1039 length:519 start_codon:yes stop_codon:yes gene_type:complete
MENERVGAITLLGNELTLVGSELKVGDPAPDFSVLGTDLTSVSLSNYGGKVKVICLVLSLDTPVCDTEIRRFNESATALGKTVDVLVVSVDLPAAQKRWCGAAGVSNVTVLSDHKDTSLGKAYGALIKELRLLSRAVFVIDTTDTVRYVEYLKEVSKEPDYEAALDAVRSVL